MTLSTRIEQASEPTPELWWEAFDAVYPTPSQPDLAFIALFGRWAALETRAYLDAAMMLVPEGWAIGSLEWWSMRGDAGVTLLETKKFEEGFASHGYDCDHCQSAKAQARHPALALLSAAMKARGL